MAFTPVATTDTLETFRTRYNATPLTIVDDSSTTVDITLATDSLKLSGGTGIASAISGDTVTFNLSNTGVSAASYGSSTAIPVIAVNAQGQITSASTASISTDLTVIDDASTSATISLATDSFKISGGTGTTSAISGDTLTINLDDTAVSAGSYGSSTAIPVLTVDAQGRLTSASTASVSTDLTIVDDSSTSATISLGTDTLKLAGGSGVSTSISGDVVTISTSSSTAFTDFIYTATTGQTTFSGADDNGNTLAYAAANFDVFLNGVLLDDSDYTATDTTSVVLSSAAAANDILTGKAWNVSNVSSFDVNGTEFVLDVDGDTSITADTDDQIDFKIGGTDRVTFNSAGNVSAVSFTGDGSSLTGIDAFPSGTKMLFQQTAAPTGWTKDTTNYNDHALRVVTGTVSSGGSSAFSTALATPSVSGSVTGEPGSNFSVSISGNIANTTLSVSQIPSHSHVRNIGGGTSNIRNTAAGANNSEVDINNINTGNTGGNQAHNHGHNLSGSLSGNLTTGNLAFGSGTASINVNYVDVIIAAKD